MKQNDPLNSVLQEWQAPDPPAAMDSRVRAAYRERYRQSPWRRLLSARISIPVPVFAALVLLALVASFYFRAARPEAPTPGTTMPRAGGYMTRLESAGFQPLPNGAARVIRSENIKQ